MRHVVRLLIPVLLAPILMFATPGASSAAIECKWTNKGEYNASKNCVGITHYLIGSKVTGGTSSYSPPYTVNPSINVNFRLTDTAADGKCTWIRARKTDSAWPFNKVQPGTKVCGKGNHKNINLYFEGLNMAPGLLEILHCKPKLCVSFWRQRIPD